MFLQLLIWLVWPTIGDGSSSLLLGYSLRPIETRARKVSKTGVQMWLKSLNSSILVRLIACYRSPIARGYAPGQFPWFINGPYRALSVTVYITVKLILQNILSIKYTLYRRIGPTRTTVCKCRPDWKGQGKSKNFKHLAKGIKLIVEGLNSFINLCVTFNKIWYNC